jgi:hypothetical protein
MAIRDALSGRLLSSTECLVMLVLEAASLREMPVLRVFCKLTANATVAVDAWRYGGRGYSFVNRKVRS